MTSNTYGSTSTRPCGNVAAPAARSGPVHHASSRDCLSAADAPKDTSASAPSVSARRLVDIDVRQDAEPPAVLLLPDIGVATDPSATVFQLVGILGVDQCDIAEAPDLHLAHRKRLHVRRERRLREVGQCHRAIVVRAVAAEYAIVRREVRVVPGDVGFAERFYVALVQLPQDFEVVAGRVPAGP